MSWSNVVVFVHVVAAMIWVGGMLFISLVAVPATRALEPTIRSGVLDRVGRRFRVVGWFALGVLVLTGLLNAAKFGYGPAALLSGMWTASTFGRLLFAKLSLVALMLILTVVHESLSSSIAPLAPGKGGEHIQPADAARSTVVSPLRKAISSWTARINLVVGLVVVFIAVVLVRGAA